MTTKEVANHSKEGMKAEIGVFAPGTSWRKLVVIFIIGSVFGCCYEMLLNFFTHLFNDHTFFWETRSAVIYGPFSVVYGVGAVLMTVFLVGKGYKWYKVFLLGALICGAYEYFACLLQEIFTGTTSWNYSAHTFNINGRTSLEIMMVWGLMSVIYVFLIYPVIDYLTKKLPVKPANTILNILIVFLCVGMIISLSAVVRQNFRRHDMPPFTPYGQFLDSHYPDERMRRAYPNMEFSEET